MDGHVNPYEVFIDVLAHRYAGEYRRALTGDLLASYAEVNHLLACTKGRLPVAVWSYFAAELERCMNLYASAWQKFTAAIDDSVLRADENPSPAPGVETTKAFQVAAQGLRTVLEELRRESRQFGCEIWVRN